MKVLVVSGFLGAGKTTFIKSLAAKTGKAFAILENEYGEADIDLGELKGVQASGGVGIWELTEGCICCTRKADFAASVLTIANAADPEYLVVEPTGLGRLSSIMSELKQIEYERITLLAPVTVVDGRGFWRQLREYPGIFTDQVSQAGSVFVSKLESASPEEKQYLAARLREINPGASVHTEHYSVMEREEWLSLLTRRHDGSRLEESGGADEEMPDAYSISGAWMDSAESLVLLMEGMARGEFGDMIRAKGSVRAGDRDFRFDMAGGRYCITGADGAAAGKAVFIGKGLRRSRIRRYVMTGVPRPHGRNR